MEDIIHQIEELYETETVVRSCIVCNDQNTMLLLAQKLNDHHHSVDVVMDEEVDDDRASYMNKLYAFQDASRMIMMTYATWYTLKDRVELDVLPFQNVFIVVNLEDGLIPFIGSYLHDAAQRGFAVPDVKSHFLVLSTE